MIETAQSKRVMPPPITGCRRGDTYATTTAVNGAGGGATGANGVNGSSSQRSGSEPASGGSGGSGPQKISLAELLGKYGMGSV